MPRPLVLLASLASALLLAAPAEAVAQAAVASGPDRVIVEAEPAGAVPRTLALDYQAYDATFPDGTSSNATPIAGGDFRGSAWGLRFTSGPWGFEAFRVSGQFHVPHPEYGWPRIEQNGRR